jgi:hypothetical protein
LVNDTLPDHGEEIDNPATHCDEARFDHARPRAVRVGMMQLEVAKSHLPSAGREKRQP